MELGIAVFATDVSWPIDDLARAVEERGFASLAVPEHTHMPVEHSDHPAGQGLPDEYRRTLDPVVALTTAATATSSLRLLFGVSLLAQHDPIVLAKAVASLDHVSAGRVEFGVGYGWNRPELEHHGVAWSQRRAVVADRVDALRALWRDDEASVDLPHAQLEPSWSWPKPVQRPGPPIMLGAALGPRTLDDLVHHFDGWLPLGRTAAVDGLEQLRRAWTDAGREGRPAVHVLGAAPKADAVRQLAATGEVDRVSFWLPSAPRTETLPVLDVYTELLEAAR
ncbi:MAG: TIGR03619 family F420-dependent LLM class oxidoreductase [Nitriliruptor sp.]|uniref:TIGR03619 family F420-dependent LLM class oxidoreductase n=1 Tax=Nitriliruptor sp. TaxID=2448056 RepID=UPI0034A08C76